MPSPSSLTRHIPAIVTGVTVAAVLISYHLYTQKRHKDKRRLKRSNARRVRRNSSRTTAAALGNAALGVGTQSQATGQQAASRTSAEGAEESNSDQEGNLITNTQLQEQLEDESALDEDASTHPETHQEPAESEYSFNQENSKENQNLLNLLYLIAEDQAKREGYVHRGVTCNSCQAQPIRGIRYRCANCVDFDLCEHCESLESHPRTHLFYKVRIPAQFLGNPRHVQPPSYPGKPGNLPLGLGMELVKEFEKKSGFDQAEVEALYEQFKCLAATEYPNDPYRICGAISRKTFDKCFALNFSARPPPPNLIYDRMFALYDTNDDGLIGFDEFILGLAALHTKLRPDDKWRRIYRGYDHDGDGYVERRDFLKMFRAYYALSKEHVQDIVASMEEEMIESGTALNVLLGSQPISAAFPSLALTSRVRGGKGEGNADREQFGEVVLPSGNDQITKEELNNLRKSIKGKDPITSTTETWASAEDEQEEGNAESSQNGIASASGTTQDTEAGEGPSGDAENISPAVVQSPSPISAPTETEQPSTPSTPIPEDGSSESYTIASEIDEDVGNEVLYQVTQQGLNELLNLLFKVKEDGAIEVRKRRERRERENKSLGASNASGAPSYAAVVAAPPSTFTMGGGSGGTTAEEQAVRDSAANIILDGPSSSATPPPPPPQPSSSSEPADGTTTSSTTPPETASTTTTTTTTSQVPPPPTTTTTTIATPKPNSSTAAASSSKHPKYERHNSRQSGSEYEKFLDRIEAEIKERGGPGRINYEEFEKLMRQDGWRKFAFVGSWVEMVSF